MWRASAFLLGRIVAGRAGKSEQMFCQTNATCYRAGMAETVVAAFEKVALAVRELDLLVGFVAADELAQVLRVVSECCNALEQVRRSVVDRACESEVWAAEGCRSPGRWVSLQAGLASGVAARVCRQVRELRSLPAVRAAALEGQLSGAQVEALTACHRQAPDRFTAAVEERFVGLAGDAGAFAAAVKAFRSDVREAKGAEPAEDPAVTASFSLVDAADGGRRGSVRLGAEDAAVVTAALDRRVSRMIQLRRDGDATLDGMTIAAMRAQALVDLCDADLRRDPSRRRAPDRHRLALTMQLDETASVVPVGDLPAASTCDVELFRLIRGAKGEILDLGRSERTWSVAQATAVIRRDGHCRFPNCDAPPGHCDVHHCLPWESGGRTDITNGVLLCRWHHTFLHRHHWSIRLDHHQHPRTYRPDGTEYALHGRAAAA